MSTSQQRMTPRGLLALALHEGVVPGPYLDVRNIWTYGIGHTAEAGDPDPAKMPRGMPADLAPAIRKAFQLFQKDVASYEAAVRRAVKVPLKPHEFDALVSFHYNTGAIAQAKLTQHLNAGDRIAAANGFMGWLKPASLRQRREAERDLFRYGAYPDDPIPVWSVDKNGRIDFRRPLRRLSKGEALTLLGSAPIDVPDFGRPEPRPDPVTGDPPPERSKGAALLMAIFTAIAAAFVFLTRS